MFFNLYICVASLLLFYSVTCCENRRVNEAIRAENLSEQHAREVLAARERLERERERVEGNRERAFEQVQPYQPSGGVGQPGYSQGGYGGTGGMGMGSYGTFGGVGMGGGMGAGYGGQYNGAQLPVNHANMNRDQDPYRQFGQFNGEYPQFDCNFCMERCRRDYPQMTVTERERACRYQFCTRDCAREWK